MVDSSGNENNEIHDSFDKKSIFKHINVFLLTMIENILSMTSKKIIEIMV